MDYPKASHQLNLALIIILDSCHITCCRVTSLFRYMQGMLLPSSTARCCSLLVILVLCIFQMAAVFRAHGRKKMCWYEICFGPLINYNWRASLAFQYYDWKMNYNRLPMLLLNFKRFKANLKQCTKHSCFANRGSFEKFSPTPGELCWMKFKTVGHSLKILGPSQKTFTP